MKSNIKFTLVVLMIILGSAFRPFPKIKQQQQPRFYTLQVSPEQYAYLQTILQKQPFQEVYGLVMQLDNQVRMQDQQQKQDSTKPKKQ